MEISLTVRSLFLTAGWQSGRRVPVSPRVPALHPAHDTLAELGGLRVGRTGAGIECAASDLRFGFCDDDEEYSSAWSILLGSAIIGIAEVHNCHGWLFLDEGGRCFGASQIHDAFYFEGNTFEEAVERLLLGRRARPMLRPDQEEISLYGETFTRGHPAVFEYRQ